MQITFDNFRNIKFAFTIVAVVIVALFAFFTNQLVGDMATEERQRIELWAEATKSLVTDAPETDFSFALKVIENNHSIPVLIADESGEVLTYRNVKIEKDTAQCLQQLLEELKEKHTPIVMELGEDIQQFLYYDDSLLLKRLAYYPYIQGGLIVAFFSVLLFFFSSAKRSEQNRVWVGLSKETAHQLGTPISSLLAWIEILKEGEGMQEALPEMEKDVLRLREVAERFSKIGSVPELHPTLLNELLDNTLAYMRKRTSNKITIQSEYTTSDPIYVNLNPPLFTWVIENLCKNAVDAIAKNGSILVTVSTENETVIIDVQDTGKGIPKSKFSTVFNPGYTTKKRGWGLGLSLVKRIVQEYHHGKIFVKKSEIGKGTTFRIEMGKVKQPF